MSGSHSVKFLLPSQHDSPCKVAVTMKFVSFNINGLRARPHQLEAIVEKHQPDVIGLQETKVHDEMFPLEEVAKLGYNVFYHGQKGHYGVALLTKATPISVRRGFPDDGEEAQRRIIMAEIPSPLGNITVINGYFPQGEITEAMLKRHGLGFEGMRVAVSGSGNVAQYAIEKAMAFGARVVTASDSSGTVVDESGFTPEKLARLCEIKASRDGRVADYAREFGLTYLEGQQPWSVPVDIALPCATQNELDVDAARVLIANGVKAVAEGANMPTTIEATDLFLEAGVLFAPGKAANAGGVATSGLEMAQNAARLSWKAEKVDARLHHIMLDIHHACVEYGGDNKHTNYVQGANIAGFVKVADAMLAQGVI